MNSPEMLTALLGWCSAINLALLVIAGIVAMSRSLSRMHAKMFGLSEEDMRRAYFLYLAQYKIVVFVFNLVPYIALRLLV